MTIEEAIKAELSKGIHGQLTDIINRAVRKGYELAEAELVHCKDCKHHKGYNCDRLYGFQDAFTVKDDDFCSRSEREEE